MKLKALLPIYALRERRAQRLYNEQSLEHGRAMSAQAHALAMVERLQQSRQSALANVLKSDEMNAFYAQGLLDQAAVAQKSLDPAQKELSDKQVLAEQAGMAVVQARELYASKVHAHHKMCEAYNLENSRETKALQARSEVEADDEFVATRLARRQFFGGVL